MRHRETGHPVLYEINTRVWLSDLSRRLGRPVTLADVPEDEVVKMADLGVDLVWLMGVWKIGEKSTAIARTHPGLASEFRSALPDLTSEDVLGSPYAVAEYSVEPRFGGTQGLLALRGQIARRGIGLILDFVPNHTGIDHRWVAHRPEFYVQGTEEDLSRDGVQFFRVPTERGEKVLAHGRDPYFPAWTDTVQFNFLNPATRAGLENILATIAQLCDGVRCDMAMLPLQDVFRTTWGERPGRTAGDAPAEEELWAELIGSVRGRAPGFVFIAEAYWGLEPRLLELGFDYAYDKTLYDRLVHADPTGLRFHLEADPGLQARRVRFIENHDEPRASAVFPLERHKAAALIAATLPGVMLFHEGQLEGRKVKVPVQLSRRQGEPRDEGIARFYERLLKALQDPVFRRGAFRSLRTRAAWDGNTTWIGFVAHEWEEPGGGLAVVVVNYGPTQGQCYVDVPHARFGGKTVELSDAFGDVRYLRDGSELLAKGLYLDMASCGFHLFRVRSHGV
ncbi:MAG: alpha-amylase [Planctomycetes bacterium]|nr:alpha-amylase [Planctomycetota bacterium]